MKKRSKIFIAGHNGMVGSAIARDLQETGHSVTVADIDKNIQDQLVPFGINYVKLDFSDLNSIAKAVKNYDLVVLDENESRCFF